MVLFSQAPSVGLRAEAQDQYLRSFQIVNNVSSEKRNASEQVAGYEVPVLAPSFCFIIKIMTACQQSTSNGGGHGGRGHGRSPDRGQARPGAGRLGGTASTLRCDARVLHWHPQHHRNSVFQRPSPRTVAKCHERSFLVL